VLKWTSDEAQAWARQVERRWESYASRPIDCDLSGRAPMGKLAAQALRSQFCFGEIVATLPFLKRELAGGVYGTKVNVISPTRLLRHLEVPRIFEGVTREPDTGFPLAYRISTPLDFSTGEFKWRDVPARDGFGRPQCLHIFDGFSGQVRGIPPITPALRVVRQFDQLADATLMQALIQAIFAATVTSPAPTDQVLQAFQDVAEQQTGSGQSAYTSPLEALIDVTAAFYEGTQIDLGSHGKIAHLAPGDKLEFHGNKTPNEFYEAFTRFLLREIARCLGLTFEELTGDYTNATYSSVRMATSVTWAIVLYRRAHISSPLYQGVYDCWLEEEIENGWVSFPGGIDGFIANRGAATRAHWAGPAKPQADDLKFAKAIDTLYRLGVVSHEWICAEMGNDWEDVYEALAREKALREKLDLPDPLIVAKPTAQGFADQGGEQEAT
jgi:lambda family phage portal protein